MPELEEGQIQLADELRELLAEVEAGEFGDFSSNKYATPKIELVKRLSDIVFRVKDGEYD